jgi:hypothetical protein
VHLEQATALARMIGSRPHEWFALSESTYPLYMLGRWDEAMAVYRELPEEHLPTGGTLLSPLSSILEIHVHRGNLEEARRLLGIYTRLETSADVQEQAGFAAASACMLHAEGRQAEAVASGERTIEFATTLGIDGQDAKMGFVWAIEAALALGDRDKVDELAAKIDAIPPGLLPPSLAAYAHRVRARVADLADQALAHHAAATAGYRQLGLRFWVAVSQLEHAETLGHEGRVADAEPLLREARAVFEELGARPWLERADAVALRTGSAEPVG